MRRIPMPGWRIRDRTEASPRLSSAINQFAQFLTLVGLTALVVGGVGVANAVRAFVEAKRKVIATFKSLGAAGPFVFRVQFFQVMAIAFLGIAIGLVIGALVPWAVQFFFGGFLPVPLETRLYPSSLGLAALYGILVALAFALWPLGTVRDVPATALFRDIGGNSRRFPRWIYLLGAAAAMIGLGAVAFLVSDSRFIAAIYLAAAGVSFVILEVGRLGRHGDCQAQPAAQIDRGQIGARQHSSARRTDAIGHPVARPRPDLAGGAGVDRCEPAPPTDRLHSRCRTQLFLSGHPEQSD
jgi:putative ABC transport system permease protein